jgi:hypothetical protein
MMNNKQTTMNNMLSDTELLITQAKYKNICWSILAIGTVIFTFYNIKK